MHLVLLHALPLSGEMWPNDMGLPIDSMIAPTLYGFGESVEAWAEGVLDVAERGPLVVAGSSVGGSCALEVARMAPDRVAAIVLVGAKAGHRREPDLRDRVIRLLADVIRGVRVFHGRPDRTQFVDTWRKPLVVVSGDQDRTPAPSTAKSLASAAPNGEFHLVQGAGHYVSLERPEQLAVILRQVMLDLGT